MVEEKTPGVGSWGGTCQCPNGRSYEVGDNNNHCKSLACANGKMVNCNKYDGEWSKRKVTCSGILWLAALVDYLPWHFCLK